MSFNDALFRLLSSPPLSSPLLSSPLLSSPLLSSPLLSSPLLSSPLLSSLSLSLSLSLLSGFCEVEADDSGCVSTERQLSTGSHVGIHSLYRHTDWRRPHGNQLYCCGLCCHNHVRREGGGAGREGGGRGREKGGRILHILMLHVYVYLSHSPPHLPPSLYFSSSTNLTELAKAVRLLAALSPTPLTGDELLKAARNLAAATAGLLNAAKPENVEVRQTAPILVVEFCIIAEERRVGRGGLWSAN